MFDQISSHPMAQSSWHGKLTITLHNKASQTGWMKTIEMYYFIALEARIPRWRCWKGHTLSEISGRILPRIRLASAGGCGSLAFLGLWLHHSVLCLSLPLCLCLFSSYKETSHIGLRSMLPQHYLILIMSAKTLFPNNVLLTSRSWDCSIPFGGSRTALLWLPPFLSFLAFFWINFIIPFFPSTAFIVLYSISLVVILRITICMWSEKVKVTRSYPTLCDTVDYIVHGILQAGIREWAAFPFSGESSQPRDRTHNMDT